MGRKREIPLPKELETFTRLIEDLGNRHDTHQVYYDFVEMAACALSNKCDPAQFEVREAQYLSIIKKYKTLEDRLLFPRMLAELQLALQRTGRDVLGPVSSALGMTSFRKGQFWTPWEVSHLMAKMLLAGNGGGDNRDTADIIRENGFLTAAEPACGPGGMILAFAQAFEEEGFNPNTQLHFTAVDVSPYCVYSAYTQCSLMGIPATVILGDSLRATFTSFWHTPAHVMGGFTRRLHTMRIDERNTRWWIAATMPERIDFLQTNNLEVSHAVADKAGRPVLDAKRAADVILQETA